MTNMQGFHLQKRFVLIPLELELLKEAASSPGMFYFFLLLFQA